MDIKSFITKELTMKKVEFIKCINKVIGSVEDSSQFTCCCLRDEFDGEYTDLRQSKIVILYISIFHDRFTGWFTHCGADMRTTYSEDRHMTRLAMLDGLKGFVLATKYYKQL